MDSGGATARGPTEIWILEFEDGELEMGGGLRFLATDIVSTQKACSAGIPGWTRLLSGGDKIV